jgi:hypothetical protein
MRYELTILLLGQYKPVALSQERFEAIKTAQKSLFVLLGIEEKLNVLMDNYEEFELELFSQNLHYMLFLDSNWTSFTTDLHTLNRRIANLLTSSRLYIDQVRHELSSLFGKDSNEFKQFSQACSQEYDGYAGYRVMEQLRNIMQHQTPPLHNLSRTNERVEHGEGYLPKSSTTVYISLSQLKTTAQIKTRVLADLEQAQTDDQVKIKPLVREYIDCINRLHRSVRTLLAPHFQNWHKVFQDAIIDLKQQFGNDITGAGILARDDSGAKVESHYLVEDAIKRIENLQQRNPCVARFKLRYISTE